MSEENNFIADCNSQIEAIGRDKSLQSLTSHWLSLAQSRHYSYHFRWSGLPIIQYPQDIVAMQELIWQIKPDLIIETGIARGGSLVFSASMLAMLDMCDAITSGTTLNPAQSSRKALGVDIDIRAHNRSAIEMHPMASRIQMIQGSSISSEVIEQVHALAKTYKTILVCLDSNHTHDHVLAELEAYAPLVTPSSYCVVFDTIIDDLSPEVIGDRPWGKGNSPKTAVHKYLQSHPEFEIDKQIDHKLLVSVAPDGYLRRVSVKK